MQEGKFRTMLGRLGDLTPRQRRTVVETLTEATALDEVVSTINARVAEAPARGLGGTGGTSLVAGVRWSFRDKDAGSARSRRLRTRLRTPLSGRAAWPCGTATFRRALLGALFSRP